MIPDSFTGQLAEALAAAEARVVARLALGVPDDVAVSATANGIRLTGRALAARSLADPRLRDFAGMLR